MVALWGRRGVRIGSSDREVDHGEKVQSEEEIREEKEGRTGQKEEDAEGIGEEEDSEKGGEKAGKGSREKAGEQAQESRLCSKGRARSNARTGARAGCLDAAKLGRECRWRWRLKSRIWTYRPLGGRGRQAALHRP